MRAGLPGACHYADTELPAHYAEWKDFNAALFPAGTQTDKKEASLPGALSLAQVHQREQTAGWTPVEPSSAG